MSIMNGETWYVSKNQLYDDVFSITSLLYSEKIIFHLWIYVGILTKSH